MLRESIKGTRTNTQRAFPWDPSQLPAIRGLRASCAGDCVDLAHSHSQLQTSPSRIYPIPFTCSLCNSMQQGILHISRCCAGNKTNQNKTSFCFKAAAHSCAAGVLQRHYKSHTLFSWQWGDLRFGAVPWVPSCFLKFHLCLLC